MPNEKEIKKEAIKSIEENMENKMSIYDFCESYGIREREKVAGGMIYRSCLHTKEEWRKILTEDQFIDFENPTYYKKEDEKRSIIEFKKSKQ